ncbi:putative kelch repeat protein [Rosellinia necatrix]|uniref:Putative kelch repeat protein n=1 Tax=Rosellinia necatrix TaxID=77044 RepID=A0A1W2TE45_ROSNE|nr:putative kelch repeat protein [Rosellinia necatrix]
MKGPCPPFVLLAVWGALGTLGLARGLRSRDDTDASDIPSAQDFIRRGCHTVAVLGDYAYIDGGRITERVDGSAPADSPSYDVNTTWSIDLTEPWTSETVRFRSIPKQAPLLSKQIHWTDPSTGSLYTYGGFSSDGSSPSQDLWRFAADGSGGGAWTQVTQRDFVAFSKLKGTFGAAFTQTKNVGFALGGAATKATDDSVDKEIPGYATPGLVSYNFRTGEWDNSTTSSYGGYGTSLNARAEYVPFGPNGMVLFLGGAETPVDATNETIVETSWNRVNMVDPVTKKWHAQMTSGTKPPTIESHCSVGVPGPNGTYEIFLYGGVSDQIRDTSSEVYVLSLPGFVFFKGPQDAPPRSDHQCAVVGKGQRQMLSMGGVDGENRTFTAPTTADPWAYGLGILDMTELKWTNSYDPDAPAYDSPTPVNDWYNAGNLDHVRWESDEVMGIFMKRDVSPTPTPGSQTVAGGPHSTGVIVGGAVAGVLGIAAIGMMSFVMVRRNRRARDDTPDPRRRPGPAESVREEIAEYKPEPWPKDEGSRYAYSPESVLSSATVHSPSLSPLPRAHHADSREMHDPWPSELPGHQDGMLPPRGAELPGIQPRVGELMDPNIQWAYELPAPLVSHRVELPDRKYSQ